MKNVAIVVGIAAVALLVAQHTPEGRAALAKLRGLVTGCSCPDASKQPAPAAQKLGADAPAQLDINGRDGESFAAAIETRAPAAAGACA